MHQHWDYLSWGFLNTKQSSSFRTLLVVFSKAWCWIHCSEGSLSLSLTAEFLLFIASLMQENFSNIKFMQLESVTRCAIKLCHLRTPTLCFKNLNYAPSFFLKMDEILYRIIQQGLNCSCSCQATAYMLPRDKIHDPWTPPKGDRSHTWYAYDQVWHFPPHRGHRTSGLPSHPGLIICQLISFWSTS